MQTEDRVGEGPAKRPAKQPAHSFVAACLRARWSGAAVDEARRLSASSEVDWAEVREIARRGRVAPLVYAVARDWALLPPDLAAEFRQDYLGTLARNMFVLHELRDVLDRLASARVDVVVLKGAALAEDVYENEGLRPMGDLDLLVRRDDVPAAIDALAAAGYAVSRPEIRAGASLAFDNEIMLWHPDRPVAPVELHWSLFDSPHYQSNLPMAWFWDTAVPGRVAGGTALVLAPEALILHLCGHLVLHHGHADSLALLWQHDVAEVIHGRAEQLDWDLVLARAASGDLVLSLQRVLPEVIEAWDAPVPADLCERLCAFQPSPDERRLHGWLSADHQPPAQRLWADLLSTPDWRSRVGLAWSHLFPSADYMRRRYDWPPALVPLAYPYRWWIGLQALRRPRSRERQDGAHD